MKLFCDILDTLCLTLLSQAHDDQGLTKPAQGEVDGFETEIRTANIITSMESLIKVVSDLKDLTILNDFRSINQQIAQQSKLLDQKEYEMDKRLVQIKDVLVKLLTELQQEYYYSSYK